MSKKSGIAITCVGINAKSFSFDCSFINNGNPGMVLKNIKCFTTIKIIDAIINNPQESRKEWMLDLFEKNGKEMKSNHCFQFWQHENHPILLSSRDMYNQRFAYLHENPERAGFVKQPQDWKNSSAIDCTLRMEKVF